MTNRHEVDGRHSALHSRGGKERGHCVCCRLRPAETHRRTLTSVGTWTRHREPVCALCAGELDELTERCVQGMLAVDRATCRLPRRKLVYDPNALLADGGEAA